jgi:hypothetical protein
MKYYLACPWYISGGPECIHQLCSELNTLHNDSYMVYDNNSEQAIPQYNHYNLKVTNVIEDNENNCIIIPETYPPNYIDNFKNIKTAYYWLSKDNVRWDLNHPSLQKIDYHLCQSVYAYNFVLNDLKIDKSKIYMVTDYTRDIMITNEQDLQSSLHLRKNIILYNPSKGQDITQKIIEMCPNFIFVPIVNMTPEQIKNLAQESKIYIDFGHHPGKDRIPREMVSCGCSLLVGLKGSATCYEDIPISSDRKFDFNDDYFFKKIVNKINEDINNFENVFLNFLNYRKVIRNEKFTFINQIKHFLIGSKLNVK